MNESELETLILRLLDGELPPQEAAELEATLLADETARATYEELVLLHNALESRFAANQDIRQMGVVPMDRLVADQQRRIVKFSALAAAAILTIAAVAMFFILAPRSAVEVASLRTTAGAAFSVSYDGEGQAPEQGQLAEGSVVNLSEGTMEGSFKSGVRMVAEAPCRVRILDKDSVSLDLGKAWFRVPPAAVGFAVQTERLKIIDLGTEFGVVAIPGERNEVHVLKGAVEVTARRGEQAWQTLKEGSALAVDDEGRLTSIELVGEAFPKELATTRAIRVVNHSFEADVLPRDGDRMTKETGLDDYDKEFLPSGWTGFDDGDGGTDGTRGILSLAPDSYFSDSLSPTPDADANDQVFFSAARDIHQILDEPLRTNSTYVLQVDIGDRWAPEEEGAPGNPGFRLGFGGIPGKGLLVPDSTERPPQVDGGWVTWTATYTTGPEPAGEGEPLRIELTSGSRVGWFDRVRLSVKR